MNLFKSIFGNLKNDRRCFEQTENVFHEPNDNYELVFYPLCSLNLKELIPNRDEWIHFVDVWNNGDVDDSFFHSYRTRDTIKFKLEDSKYFYLGNEQAFPKYSELRHWYEESKKEFETNLKEYTIIPIPELFQNSIRNAKEIKRKKLDFDYFLYVDQIITYLVNKERYRVKGNLITHKSFPNGYKVKSHELIRQIGGEPQWGQRDMTPKNENGDQLTFIGQLVGFHYMANGSDNIYLFLDEVSNEVVQIFQYG